jgi:hypothetical protein
MPNLYPSDPADSDVFNYTSRREAERDEVDPAPQIGHGPGIPWPDDDTPE